MAFNWTCPYCNRAQTVTEGRFSSVGQRFTIGETSIGSIGLQGEAICCSNEECLRPTVTAWVQSITSDHHGKVFFRHGEPIIKKRMIPESSAKPQPEFIPLVLREDYLESCLIRDLSPKASATLARRCLQGMLRDFCGVSGKTLFAEIEALRLLIAEGKAPMGVSLESVEAIHHVREVGNIGAHMEKDIDHIVPVEPEEAQLLIELIESLFEEWYVARETRVSRFREVKALAESKKTLISELRSLQIEGPKATE
jgi:hypothetical protein